MHNTADIDYPNMDVAHLKNWWSEHSRAHHPLSIKYLPECESTNAQLYRSPSLANTLLVTEIQTQGRGQFEREWQTHAGDLIFSLGLHLPSSKIPALSIRVGLALAHVLGHLGYAAQLKWPNDVILNNGKLAGILVQTAQSEHADMNWVVIGVGLNIVSRARNAPHKKNQSAFNPIGLAQVDAHWLAPKAGEREALLMQLVDQLLLHIDGEHALGGEFLASQWNAHDIWLNQAIVWIDPFGQQHHGIGQGIDASDTYQMDTPRGPVAIYSGQLRSALDFPAKRLHPQANSTSAPESPIQP